MAKSKKTIINKRHPGIWILFIVVFIVELLFYTWCRVQYIRIGYEISAASDEYNHLLAEQNKLKIEVASLKSPERIGKIAQQRFGLMLPQKEQIIVIP